LLALTATACGGGGNGGSGGSGGGGGNVSCTNSGNTLAAKDANNYSFSSTLTFPVTKVKPMSELTFDWSAVSKSFLGHTVDAKKDINMVSVLMWKLPIGDLQTRLNADTLAQRDLVVVPLTLSTNGTDTSAKLFSFTLNGGAVDQQTVLSYFDASFYTPNENYTYTVMAAKGTTVGQGVQMIQAFQLDPTSSNTEVKLSTDSTKLEWSANLHNLALTGLPAGKADLTMNWDAVTKTALGGTFEPTSITNVLIGHYTQSVSELETKFLDIELIATDLFKGVMNTGTSIDLSTLQTDGGKAFSGIDGTGTWMVALQCGSCRNPAPWYLSILKTCQ
jgi:hypothetical protein